MERTNVPAPDDVVRVPLSRLVRNPDYQPRRKGISEAHVRLLMEAGPETWEPITVAPVDGGRFDVIDGNHRVAAGIRLKLAALPCHLVPGAGYPEAVAANLAHGLPLTLADRKDFARWLTQQQPGLSLREIGRRCGLNHATVKRAIQDGAEGGEHHQRSRPDPIGRLVSHVYRTYADGNGRTWLGIGREGNPKPFRRAIEAYREEDRAAIARAMHAFGRACVTAAEPFLSDG
jgi:hypothetical protein